MFIGAGHTAVQERPDARSSSFSAREKNVTYAFVALYTAMFGLGENDAMDDVFSTRAPRGI